MTSWIWNHLPELGLAWIVASVPAALLAGRFVRAGGPAPHDPMCDLCRFESDCALWPGPTEVS
jgi:hypothetical protein